MRAYDMRAHMHACSCVDYAINNMSDVRLHLNQILTDSVKQLLV